MTNDLDPSGLNRAGRRAAEKRAKRMRAAGAALAAGAATFGTTATLVGVTASSAGAAELTVTNLDPSGAGSLHDVAEAAGNGDVIVFQAGLTGTIFLDDDIDIDTSITIQGPGAGVLTVSGDTGNNSSADVQIFNIDGGATAIDVVISGLTMTMGTAFEGGAVQVNNANSVVIRDSVFTGNHADDGGGAIEATDSDTPIHLTVANSDVSGNTSGDYGGGLYFYSEGGSLTVTNSTFNNNDADGGGGAAWTGTTGSINVTGTTISNNTANNGRGGGFAIFGATATVSGSTVTGNTTDDDGGGLYFGSNYSVVVENSTISGNTADDDGGGITFYNTDGSVTVTNSTISGNTAGDEGGGLYFYNVGGDINITNTSITGNTAESGGGAFFYDTDGDALNITGSVISGNHANDGDGGGLYFGYVDNRTTIAFTTIEGNDAIGTGGGINWYSSGVLRVLNSTVSGNTGNDAGGGLYISVSNYDVVEIFNSTISGNTTGGEGGGISFASYYGLQIAQSTITGNTGATVGGLAIYCFEDDSLARSAEKKQTAHEKDVKEGPQADAAGAAEVRQQRVRAQDFGEVTASGTIISGNTGTDVGECGALSSDHSLIGTIVGTTLTDLGGTILGKLPLVAPLANNGGPTKTHALLPDSPAINTGPVPVASFEGNNNDQRGEGFPRVVAGVVDIGAYEVQPPQPNFTG